MFPLFVGPRCNPHTQFLAHNTHGPSQYKPPIIRPSHRRRGQVVLRLSRPKPVTFLSCCNNVRLFQVVATRTARLFLSLGSSFVLYQISCPYTHMPCTCDLWDIVPGIPVNPPGIYAAHVASIQYRSPLSPSLFSLIRRSSVLIRTLIV